jgi:superkiller protein 3
MRSLMKRQPTADSRRGILLALLSATLAACTGDSGAPHLARGNVLVNNGKREEAAAEYAEAARLSPKSEVARERLGDTLYDLGRKDEALAAYRQAARVDPNAATARIGAARVLADKGDVAGARNELSAALQSAPSNLYARLSRGNLAARAGDRRAALDDYATAVHLKSDNVPALTQYGLALLDDGQVDEAERTFDRVVTLAPDAPTGWYGRARVLARKGDGAAAGAALAEALRRILPEAQRSLREQGVPAAQLDQRAEQQAQAARAQLESEPAFAAFANDAAFRAAAGFTPGDRESSAHAPAAR